MSTKTESEKVLPDLVLIKQTIEDIVALVTHIMGGPPDAQTIARGKAKLDAAAAQLPRK